MFAQALYSFGLPTTRAVTSLVLGGATKVDRVSLVAARLCYSLGVTSLEHLPASYQRYV